MTSESMCGRCESVVVQETCDDGITTIQMDGVSSASALDGRLSGVKEDESSNQHPIENPDRHQGWHTEFCGLSSNWHRPSRATDYVVRTSFVRKASKNKPSEGSRVNLILRFRSLLSRRGSSHHHQHQQQLTQEQEQRAHKNTPFHRRSNQQKLSCIGHRKFLESECASATSTIRELVCDPAVSTTLKRASSDSCLYRPHNHSHVTLLRIPDSFVHSSVSPASATSPVSDSTAETSSLSVVQATVIATSPSSSHAQRNAPIRRRSSLSTGNICCLYALRCLPSVEYLNIPLGRASPAMRRRSLPVSSLKSYAQPGSLLHDADEKFALNSLRQHPCYQNVQRNLNQWIKRTLDANESNDSELNGAEDVEGNDRAYGSRACSQDLSEWTRHVRFADEATGSSSATTLNSLSASSSARSLTSLLLTPNTRSPYGSFLNLEPTTSCSPSPGASIFNMSAENRSNQSGSSSKTAGFHPVPRRLLKKFSQLSTSRPVTVPVGTLTTSKSSSSSSPAGKSSKSEHGDKMMSLSRRIWRRRNKRQKDRRNIPLVTVNLINDYSEPPEVPSHVLKELHVEEEQPFWKPMFANPDELPHFEQQLYRQQLHLGRISSRGLKNISVDVYVVSSAELDHEPSPQIRLRYTLNNWLTYNESDVLTKIHTKKMMLSPCGTFWVEIHSGCVQLNSVGCFDDWEPDRLEFAVVARRNGSEWWDNNDRQNYVCCKQQADEF